MQAQKTSLLPSIDSLLCACLVSLSLCVAVLLPRSGVCVGWESEGSDCLVSQFFSPETKKKRELCYSPFFCDQVGICIRPPSASHLSRNTAALKNEMWSNYFLLARRSTLPSAARVSLTSGVRMAA